MSFPPLLSQRIMNSDHSYALSSPGLTDKHPRDCWATFVVRTPNGQAEW